MPVMTRIITDESGSSRSVNAAVKSPDLIHVNTGLTIARESGGMPTSRHTPASETAKEPSIAPQATAPAAALLTRLPRLAFSRNPRNGSSAMSRSISGPRAFVPSWSMQGSPFQARERVGVQRLAVTEEADHDREADGGLRRRHRHHEEHDDLTIRRAQRPAEGDERQVDGIEHDLDRQEDRNQVPPHEYAGRAYGEEDGRQNQIMVERDHHAPPRSRPSRGVSRLARTTAPT